MNIKITYDDASFMYIQANKFILKTYQKKARLKIILLLSISIVFIAFDLLTFHNCWKLGGECYNLHLGLGIGCAYILFIIGMHNRMSSEIYEFNKKVDEFVKRHFGASTNQSIIIDNDSIKIESSIVRTEYKWAVVTSYFEWHNYISLVIDSQSFISLDREKLDVNELNDLMAYLQLNKAKTIDATKPI